MAKGPGGEKRPAGPPDEAGQPNWAHQTIWTGDNLDIMRGMNSASVDLIYLDPPFNSKADYAAPIGSKAAGAAFKDTWGPVDVNLAWRGEIKHDDPGLYALLDATRAIHGDSMMGYLIYMAIRVMEMKRRLKPTGSIHLPCDPTAGHDLKHHFELRNVHVDHIIPRAKGGADHRSSLQLSCGACHSMKGTRSQEHWLVLPTNKGRVKHRMAARFKLKICPATCRCSLYSTP